MTAANTRSRALRRGAGTGTGKAVDARFVGRVADASGRIAVGRMVAALHTSAADLAATVGLPREAVVKAARQAAPRTQLRLREAAEVITLLAAHAGSVPLAYAYYRAEPIPAFGGRTAEALVKEGHAGVLRDYLDHISQGGFA